MYNDEYLINIEIVIKGECTLENTNLKNPIVMGEMSSDQAKELINKVANDFFRGLTAKNDADLEGEIDFTAGAPNFTVSNQNGDYTVSGGVFIPVQRSGLTIIKYINGISREHPCDNWLVKVTGKMATTLSIKSRDQNDNTENNSLLDKVISFFKEHAPSSMPQIPTRLWGDLKPVLNNMYDDTGNFIDDLESVYIEYEPVLQSGDQAIGQFM